MKIKLRVHAIIISSLLIFASALNALSSYALASDNQQRANKSRTTLTAQESAGTRFKGSVADAKFEMSLRREGDELKGSYFYSKSGSANSLSLRGKIDAGGNFTMQEFDSSGKQTGEFKGKWKDDQNQSGAYLEGEWKKPNAKEAQIFWASEQMIETLTTARRIAELPKLQRAVVVLRFFEDRTEAHTAEILGITPALCAPDFAEAASNVASSGKRGRRGLGGHARSQTPIGRQQIATYHRSSRLRSLSTWRPRSNTHANRSTRSARLTGRTVASSSRA